MPRQFNALGVYIYAGGFSQGVARHMEITAHLEEGNFGVQTVRDNLGVEVYTEPVGWPVADIKRRVGEIDFVHSNPPCAPWSNAGKVIDGRRGAAYAGDERLACVERSFDVFFEAKARVWAWESVARTPVLARDYIEALAKRAGRQGHECTVLVLDASQCGAPQYRKRAFVLMHDVKLEFPLDPKFSAEPVTVRQALRAAPKPRTEPRPPVSPTTAKWLHHVPEGGKLNKVYDRVHKTAGKSNVSGRPGFLQRRLAWDRPAFTITGGCHHYHPDEPRYISVYESAALCGFPRDWDFAGATSVQYAQVGKGVMPPVGAWLAKNVAAGLAGARRVAQPGRVNLVDLSAQMAPPIPGC